MTILVAGGERVDAGKTTFSAGLVARTGAVGFKPRAGNNRWFDQDDVARAIADGRLFGKDAARLVAASPGDLDPAAINPVHRLWQPSPGPGTGLLGQEDREFLVDRVARPQGGPPNAATGSEQSERPVDRVARPPRAQPNGHEWVLNGTVELPAPLRRNLPLDPASDAVTTVESVRELNEVTAGLHLPALDRLAERIAATDRALVESYGDVARPLRDIEPTAVAVVEPGRVRLYDGDRYRKACELATGSPDEGTLEERIPTVVDLLDPAARIALPALGSDVRSEPERIARAYEDAYDTLLDLAAWS
jgi:predicted P-loop ATPase/GTPase